MRRKSHILFVIIMSFIFGNILCYAEDTVSLATITIPDNYGSIIETHNGTNGKLIVHIQDAHVNYEAQKNIAAILESLVTNYNLKLILKEGGATDKDFSYLRKEASSEARKRAAEKLLKNATIAGVDYFNLTTNYSVSFQGIEDKTLYDANRNALWEMDKFKDAALEYINNLIAAAGALKTKIYNADLLAIDKAKKDYESGNIVLQVYYKTLNDIIQKKNVDITEFPNFSSMVGADKYSEKLKNLNINKLFKEEFLAENKIQEAVSENDDQKALCRISRALSIMDNMLNVNLVPEEYDYFLGNKKDFNPQEWADFLNKKSEELSLGLNISSNYYAISDNMDAIERFYSTAGERDRVFVIKSEERMNKDNVKIAALIAGGFHTPALTTILADTGYSYIVISPRVTTKTDNDLYRKALKND